MRTALPLTSLLFMIAGIFMTHIPAHASSVTLDADEMEAAGNSHAPTRIVVFGDSLSAGYNLPPDDSFPAQLERELLGKGYSVTVINGGISGDTTAGGISRLEWLQRQHPDLVILALGANDALRGLPPEQARANLADMIRAIHSMEASVLLAGMKAPRNYGMAYATEFDAIYASLAEEYQLVLYPFFLEGVALKREFNLSDGLHPNSAGVKLMVENILPTLTPMLPAPVSTTFP